MKRPIAATLFLLAFCGAAFFIFKTAAGEVYLKSGKGLYALDSPFAAQLLGRASRLACGDPAAHHLYAEALQKEAAAIGGNAGTLRLLDARAALRRALDLRTDAYLLDTLGRNFALEGRPEEALAAHNAAFFLSQNPASTGAWMGILETETRPAARHALRRGELGTPLIILYNGISAYAPFYSQKENPAARWVENFLRALPPERWLGATLERDGPLLKRLYEERGAEERSAISSTLESNALEELAAYLEAR